MSASPTCATPSSAWRPSTASRWSSASAPCRGPGPAPSTSRSARWERPWWPPSGAWRWPTWPGRRGAAAVLAKSEHLGHLVGVNGFFTALVRSARQRTDATLATWWSERRCAAAWGEVVRPDGYGVWAEGGARLPFLLEYDNGTERLARLADKLPGYARLAGAAGYPTWVLFRFPSTAREARRPARPGPTRSARRHRRAGRRGRPRRRRVAGCRRQRAEATTGRPWPPRGTSGRTARSSGAKLWPWLAGTGAALVLLVVLTAGAAGAGLSSVLGLGSLLVGGAGAPSTNAVGQIPPAMLVLYQEAAATCPGLSWAVLAAIGTVESDNGTSDLPGVHSGANYAGAEGPMQFEPKTFAEYDEPVPPGGAVPPSPYDPVDAVYAAARDLCANGAGEPAELASAVFAYNHSAAYVSEVLALAGSYA